MAQTWEYMRYKDTPTNNEGDVEAFLSGAGREGWELVGFAPTFNTDGGRVYHEYVLKRLKLNKTMWEYKIVFKEWHEGSMEFSPKMLNDYAFEAQEQVETDALNEYDNSLAKLGFLGWELVSEVVMKPRDNEEEEGYLGRHIIKYTLKRPRDDAFVREATPSSLL